MKRVTVSYGSRKNITFRGSVVVEWDSDLEGDELLDEFCRDPDALQLVLAAVGFEWEPSLDG